MDDKFNQWCKERFIQNPQWMTFEQIKMYESEYKLECLDSEITELKRRIEILETPKNV